MKIYLVGGAVRDQLLNKDVKDKDWVVVGATPDDMLSQGYMQVGADFPVFLHPDTRDEYALARTERKTRAGYHGFEVYTSADVALEDDLSRRDLTINAMAMADDGTILDPFNGQADLENKVLRHVGPAFAEDPVRILRIARFAARYEGFTVASETMDLMRKMVEAGEIDALVPERVWQELSRGLMEATPSRMLDVLLECGALAKLLPEVAQLKDVPQPLAHHPENCTYLHCQMALDYAASQGYALPVRYAVLMHDLGKGITPKDKLPFHHSHEELGIPLVVAVSDRLKVPKECKKLALHVCEFHTHFHRARELSTRKMVKLFARLDLYRNERQLLSILQACLSDARGRLNRQNDAYPAFDEVPRIFAETKKVDTRQIALRFMKDPTQIPVHVHAARVGLAKALRRTLEGHNR